MRVSIVLVQRMLTVERLIANLAVIRGRMRIAVVLIQSLLAVE